MRDDQAAEVAGRTVASAEYKNNPGRSGVKHHAQKVVPVAPSVSYDSQSWAPCLRRLPYEVASSWCI